MNIPKGFRPKKDLNKKVEQLLEGPKLRKSTSETYVDDILTNFKVNSLEGIDFKQFYAEVSQYQTSTLKKIIQEINEEMIDSPKEFNTYFFDIE